MNIPYGYVVDPATHRLVPHAQEQHVVREIFTMHAGTRLGTRAVDKLNEQGKRTEGTHRREGRSKHRPTRVFAQGIWLWAGRVAARTTHAGYW